LFKAVSELVSVGKSKARFAANCTVYPTLVARTTIWPGGGGVPLFFD
jgi:hypothetical protein